MCKVKQERGWGNARWEKRVAEVEGRRLEVFYIALPLFGVIIGVMALLLMRIMTRTKNAFRS